MIEMDIRGIVLDPITNMPIVVLQSKETDDILSIWIGVFEANAISMKLENIHMPRPMTYDLMVNLIENLSADISYILINDLNDNTYYAEIVLNKDGQEIRIDSRPSDAINLAIRKNVPIFVEERVLQEYKKDIQSEVDENELEEWIKSLKPEDFES
ncbi:bifunctional nuclease family protein [Hydrogenothermus marinus]|uniref:BFN domain-containing protein n=1 Tax=Hydrogenothermus marinus TaxID=133270 RepID=A0A3M0B799_9AQUI|nr:bifunctional nuclease family protein [Hydrogenothermus marinus]RMA93290.1 hypothetical protein CLV39_1352 [Hydrogenothermus marinus]